jgi:CRISPR-associated protein Csx3
VAPPLRWTAEASGEHIVALFEATSADGLIAPSSLPLVSLPEAMRGQEHRGVIFSGRGPIWLYGHLLHLAHAHAWVAMHDPRLQGAVVVCRHRPDAPALGSVVAIGRAP